MPESADSPPRLLAVVTAVERARNSQRVARFRLAVPGPEGFVSLGRVAAGMGADVLRSEEPRFEALTLDRHGATRWLKPELVVEVAVDRVRREGPDSFKLGRARVVALRPDLLAHTVPDVGALARWSRPAGSRRSARRAARRVVDPATLPLFSAMSRSGGTTGSPRPAQAQQRGE